MSVIYNVFTGNFDYVGSGGSNFFQNPVATEGALPLTDADGTARVVTATDRVYVFNLGSTKWYDSGLNLLAFSNTASSTGATLTTTTSGNVIKNDITITAADASNPGSVSTTTQTFAGNKTFSGTIAASNLSGTNTGDITLGAVGSSPNSNAAALSGQILTLEPADGTNPGLITAGTQTIGGAKTFNSTISASNFSGSSSGTNTGDLTLTAVGSTPSANAASLSGQALTMQPADGTHPGVLTSGAQTIGGAKTFSAAISASNLSGTNTGDQNITLTGDVAGTGTGSFATTIQSNVVSNSKLAQMAANTIKGNNTAGLANAVDLTVSQTQALLSITPSSTGDIKETSFTAADNQVAAANITGFTFTSRSFNALVSIVRSSTYAEYTLQAIQKAASWEMSQDYVGDVTGITFSITNAGQLQYTSTSTGSTATVEFRAITTT